MKYAVVVSMLLLAACAKAPTSTPAAPKAVAVERPSQELCDKAYDNLLGIVLQNSLGEGESYDAYQTKVGKKLLDQQLFLSGKKVEFYDVCLTKATPPMVDCWSQAPSLEGMDVCTLLWSGKHSK